MNAIETIQLTKKYKDLTAVDQLDLKIQKGDLFALLGVNGAGKTTTIKMLTCLTKPTGGDAIILGSSITKDATKVKEIIGVSPQETAVAPNLTVKENLELMCGVYGFSKEKIKIIKARESKETRFLRSPIFFYSAFVFPREALFINSFVIFMLL